MQGATIVKLEFGAEKKKNSDFPSGKSDLGPFQYIFQLGCQYFRVTTTNETHH